MAPEYAINRKPITGVLEDPEHEPLTSLDFMALTYLSSTDYKGNIKS